MFLFWIGTAVFFAGIIWRHFFKLKYYKDYSDSPRLESHRKELSAHYRPKIFTGLAIQIVGCILIFISILVD